MTESGGQEKFRGFPAGKVRQIPVPSQFFTELLPQIQDAGELKITLYAFWRLSRAEGTYRYFSLEDLKKDERLMAGLGPSAEDADEALQAAVRLCVERGTLLKTSYMKDEAPLTIYFLNTPRGRMGVEAVGAGVWNPAEEPVEHFELSQEPVNIFRLYENQIGPLNPMIAEALTEAEAQFPEEWIYEAFQIAAENNVRRWRYIEVILQRWSEEGKDERRIQGDSEEDRQRYVRGEFSEYVEH
ncbi:MAG: DnaD domain protein [Anaerolineales bacterium]|nr:DnaD domain protein [Anaerolineales bacterium]